ncbi:phospholipase, patatin family protein [Cardiosporidium cionae]|uniref:Phospholipase, patatin family protein n=1 Tax=Cardiosporidium cionae TaxID=476202 RepID=A0ABQ7J9M4_9APIC|nr:phospholipase, patatin family protein [Cardiosporidium cionae]|eukprot:KAF8820654.1 phospholipase, patatin family protein [Cardiosporidium cionae]
MYFTDINIFRLLDVRGNLKPSTLNFNPIFLYQLLHSISHGAASTSCSSKVLSVGANTDISFPSNFSSNGNTKMQELPATVTDAVNKMIASLHPVLQILYKRKAEGSIPGNRTDSYKLALSIEGGAMRGCISAGMVVAMHYLGFTDCFDIIYGSSAGSLVGAYLISRQIPYEGCQIYYKWLPAAGRKFINVLRMGRCIGLGPLLDGDLKNFIFDRLGKPSLNLDILLDDIVKQKQPLNWASFWKWNQVQPLKVIASGLLSEKGVILDSAHGNFQALPELLNCIRASMLLPGIAGPVVYLRTPGTSVRRINASIFEDDKGYAIPRFQKPITDRTGEPMADAMLYEPIPYRSALQENCTHVLVLRTQADEHPVTRTGGFNAFMEQRMSKRFFQGKYKLPNIYRHIKHRSHRLIYMEDILTLNEATNDRMCLKNARNENCSLFAIALPAEGIEISRSNLNRKVLFEGIRAGFARAFNTLVEDPDQRGKGDAIAKQIFPDRILNEVSRFKWTNTDASPLPSYEQPPPTPTKSSKELLEYVNTVILKHSS